MQMIVCTLSVGVLSFGGLSFKCHCIGRLSFGGLSYNESGYPWSCRKKIIKIQFDNFVLILLKFAASFVQTVKQVNELWHKKIRLFQLSCFQISFYWPNDKGHDIFGISECINDLDFLTWLNLVMVVWFQARPIITTAIAAMVFASKVIKSDSKIIILLRWSISVKHSVEMFEMFQEWFGMAATLQTLVTKSIWICPKQQLLNNIVCSNYFLYE